MNIKNDYVRIIKREITAFFGYGCLNNTRDGV